MAESTDKPTEAPTSQAEPVSTKEPTKAQLAAAEADAQQIEDERYETVSAAELDNYAKANAGYRPVTEPKPAKE